MKEKNRPLEQVNFDSIPSLITTSVATAGVPLVTLILVGCSLNFAIFFAVGPEVSAEQPVVHGGVGHQVELSCLVYADPPAEVVWYRDTMRLDPNGKRYMESRGSRHTLILRSVEKDDFANYSCYATNTLGKARAYLTLRGREGKALNEVSSTLKTDKMFSSVSFFLDGKAMLSWRRKVFFSLFFSLPPSL